MFKWLRTELAKLAAEGQRQKMRQSEERLYINAAWTAQQAGRMKSVEENLVQLTLLRLRRDFSASAWQDSSLLHMKTPSGANEKDQVRYDCRVKGKRFDAFFASDVSYHTRLLGDDTVIGGTPEADKIKSLAEQFDLKASYLYANPELLQERIEQSGLSNGSNGAPRISLILTRA
ncbi:MAG: hypothetical protein AAF244_05090 [Pseudomonadota bacterium]